jgi:hypothetical protein
MEECLVLLKQFNALYQSNLIHIRIYSDGAGVVVDDIFCGDEEERIFYKFKNLNELKRKLQNKLSKYNVCVK